MYVFDLPPAIADLVAARNRVRDYYKELHARGGHQVTLDFTLDGNLVGDIGEALAVELFGIKLVGNKSHPGIDGCSPCGKTVQVKATGRGLGPAFRQLETRAEHLLFFDLDFDRCKGEVFYNGPEHRVIATLPAFWKGQRNVSRSRLLALNKAISDEDRLPVFGLSRRD